MTLSPRVALNLVYAHRVQHLDAESRKQFDAWLWSDPARELELMKALGAV